MLLTLKILFLPEATEGVDASQTTAMRDLYMAKVDHEYEDGDGKTKSDEDDEIDPGDDSKIDSDGDK